MHFLITSIQWFGSVIVAGFVLSVLGNLATPKIREWYAATSQTRAARSIEDMEYRLTLISFLRRNPSLLTRRMFSASLRAIATLAAGLLIIFAQLPGHSELITTISTFKVNFGAGVLSSVITIARVYMKELDDIQDFEKLEERTKKRIDRLKTRFPNLANPEKEIVKMTVSSEATPTQEDRPEE